MLSRPVTPHKLLQEIKTQIISNNSLSSHASLNVFKKGTLTFKINAMLVSQIQDIIPYFGLNWDPLARPIYIHNIHPIQQSERIHCQLQLHVKKGF